MVVFTSGIVDVRCRSGSVRVLSTTRRLLPPVLWGGGGCVGVEPGCGTGWWVVGTLLGV